VHLGGEVDIGEGALVGIGSSILPRFRIGTWSVIGGGSLVNHDVPDFVTAFGVPAKVIHDTQ
jgi:acetyltransferase-like isoleucine patch superfamily enzyme